MSKAQLVYINFITETVRRGEVWMLMKEERVAIVETEGGAKVPLWASQEEANGHRVADWKDFEPVNVSLPEFLCICVPEFSDDDVDAIIGLDEEGGIARNIEELDMDLRDEADEQGVDLDSLEDEVMDMMESVDVYDDIIEEIVENGVVWALFDEDGEAIYADTDVDEKALPIWTSGADAALQCREEWDDCVPGSNPLDEFIEEWIPLLDKENTAVLFILDEEEAIGSDVKSVEQDLLAEIGLQFGYEDAEDDDKDEEDTEFDFDNVIPFPGVLH